MSYQLLAIFSSLIMVALELTLRALQRSRDQGWFLSLLGSCVGGLVLLPFVPISSLHLAPSTIGLLIVAGLAWTISILAEYKSHVSLQVGVGALISSVRAVLLVLVGATLFGEAFSRQDTLGAVLAIAGVLIACPLAPGASLTGIGFRFLSITANTVAIVTEKFLAQTTSIELIIVVGYLLPAVMYLLVRPRDWREQCVLGPPKRRLLIGLYVILYTLIGPTFVVAFALGNLGETFVISQSRPVLLMILGALVLHERSHLIRRGIAMAVTLAGLYLLVN